ncbi:MAG TPA: hypothetical protein VGD45_09610 [Steroidobacter sp.]|uniref:hypothetical protein n=1 Tax=Steroidobacter sp. TaxID=1978227 RepID=UPI002ED993C3
MKYRSSRGLFAARLPAVLMGSILAMVCVVGAPASHAANAKKAAGWKLPRTAEGKPDLQGNWTNATLTQLERSAEFGDRKTLTAEEAQKIEGYAAKHVEDNAKPTDPKLGIEDLPKDCGYGFTGTNCGYNNFWVDRGTQVIRIDGQPRSSIITEPANGRIPSMTPAAAKEASARVAAFRKGAGPVDGPEIRSLGERCLTSFGSSAGPPMLPLMYNNTYSIVQTKDTVMILVEMIHDARVVRIDGTHAPSNVKKWYGDSIGRWEGDTLVVETTNFHPHQTFRGLGPDRKVTERFTRISADQILYQFKVEDPGLSQPFAGELPLNATPDLMYEYACHEGNYALPGILAGAREEEKQAAGKAVKQNEADNDKGEE